MTESKTIRRKAAVTAQQMEFERRRTERLLATRRGSSPMSNAKWRKALRIIADPALRIDLIRWKFVDREREIETRVPPATELGESSLRDGQWQPFVFKEIEWIAVVPPDTALVMDAFAQRGQFDVEQREHELRVYGYR